MKHPANITQLREIKETGEAKVKRWGEEILALLAKLEMRKTAEPATPTKNQGGIKP